MSYEEEEDTCHMRRRRTHVKSSQGSDMRRRRIHVI
jgi:hypothetical protein